MREIKFRAFDPVLGMREVLELAGDGSWWKVATAQAIYTLNEGPLMQFTGLRDRNGVEIYEGDIVSCLVDYKQHGNLDRVQFSDGEFCLAHRNRSIRNWMLIEELDGVAVDCHVEVIGSVYETPELLNAESSTTAATETTGSDPR